jgi:hypothetical protein
MEKIGLFLSFEEIKVRGSENTKFILRATEYGTGDCEVSETLSSTSWEEFKVEFPTLESILSDLFHTTSWSAEWCNNQRILFIEEIEGHEGLYDFNKEEGVEVSASK